MEKLSHSVKGSAHFAYTHHLYTLTSFLEVDGNRTSPLQAFLEIDLINWLWRGTFSRQVESSLSFKLKIYSNNKNTALLRCTCSFKLKIYSKSLYYLSFETRNIPQ